MFRTKSMALAGLAGSLVMASMVMSTTAGASTPGVTANTITLGLITELTGPGAAVGTGMVKSAQGAHRSAERRGWGRWAQDQAHRNGRPDQPDHGQNGHSRPHLQGSVRGDRRQRGHLTAATELLQQAGVPVTGGAYDGPEWYEQPNTNMFSISGPGDAKDPQYDNAALFAKDHGGTKCGAVGYGISPSSAASASGFVLSCEREGLQNTIPRHNGAVRDARRDVDSSSRSRTAAQTSCGCPSTGTPMAPS